MSSPKKSSSRKSGEQQRSEVLLEEILSRVKTLADGQVQLDQKIDRQIEQLQEEMNLRFSVIEQVVKQNSGDLQKNSVDMKAVQQVLHELHQEVKFISNRMKEHEQTHAS